MRRVVELAVFTGLAILFHVALFAQPPDEGAEAGGSGGEALVSLQAADATVTDMVAAWQRPIDRQPPPEPELAPIEAESTAPNLPRLDLAEARRAEMRLAAMPPAETETLDFDAPKAPVRPRAQMPEIARPDAPETSLSPDMPRPETTRPERSVPPKTVLTQPQAEALEIETEAAEPPPSDAAPVTSVRPPERPAPQPRTEPRPQPQTARKAEKTTTGTAAQRAAGSGGSAQAGNARSARTATLSKGQQAKLQAVWGAKIRARIERAKRYPRGTNASGQVSLAISIGRDGQLQGVSIRRSSGNGALDKAAVDAVRRAGRFPAAPKDLPGNSFAFSLAIVMKR
ncbi:TonB family protein [Lutimaribacter marinistellae]|uniref:TonB family protein n=1 Tax=Lutimaribacter marinistellae TaxID=1820329 RepID=A0ABV7THH3_9RHOB